MFKKTFHSQDFQIKEVFKRSHFLLNVNFTSSTPVCSLVFLTAAQDRDCDPQQDRGS